MIEVDFYLLCLLLMHSFYFLVCFLHFLVLCILCLNICCPFISYIQVFVLVYSIPLRIHHTDWSVLNCFLIFQMFVEYFRSPVTHGLWDHFVNLILWGEELVVWNYWGFSLDRWFGMGWLMEGDVFFSEQNILLLVRTWLVWVVMQYVCIIECVPYSTETYILGLSKIPAPPSTMLTGSCLISTNQMMSGSTGP